MSFRPRSQTMIRITGLRAAGVIAFLALTVSASSAHATDFSKNHPNGFFWLGPGCCNGDARGGTRDYVNVPGTGTLPAAQCDLAYSRGTEETHNQQIQTGFHRCSSGAANGPCVSHPNWWSFVEIEDAGGSYHCTQFSDAGSGVNHKYSVYTGGGPGALTWTAFIDGASTGISLTFATASDVEIHEGTEYTGGFNDSFQVSVTFPGPWERWNGSSWVAVQSSYVQMDDGWVRTGGPPNSFTIAH